MRHVIPHGTEIWKLNVTELIPEAVRPGPCGRGLRKGRAPQLWLCVTLMLTCRTTIPGYANTPALSEPAQAVLHGTQQTCLFHRGTWLSCEQLNYFHKVALTSFPQEHKWFMWSCNFVIVYSEEGLIYSAVKKFESFSKPCTSYLDKTLSYLSYQHKVSWVYK